MIPKALIAWLAVGFLSLLAVALGSDGVRLAGFPVLVVACGRLAEGLPAGFLNRRHLLVEAFGPVLLLLLCTVLYGRLLLGDMPVNHDHPVLLTHAWITGTQLLEHGSLTGFSTTMFAGYPANSLYSLGTDLLVIACKILSLGLLSWEGAYCLALFVFVVATGLSYYALGRRFGGVLAGTVAGILGIIDRGAWFQSGWDFNLSWGVWSMGLSFTLCLFTFLALDRLLVRMTVWNFVGTSAAMGFALLSHPMAVAILGISLPLFLLARAFVGELPAPGLWLPRVTGALSLGVGLAAFWLFPFVTRKDWYEPLADPWISFEDVIRGLLDGNLLGQFSPLFLVAGILGLLLLARQRQAFPWFLLVTSGLLLFFASNTFLLTFDVLKKFPSLGNLQPQRFTYFVRTALILGCGFLIHFLWKLVPPTSNRETPALRHGRRFLIGALVAPFLLFLVRTGPSPYLAPANPLTWSSGSPEYRDLRSAGSFLDSQDRASLDRIAIVASTNEHLLLSLPVYTSLAVFKVGFTPENNYRFKFDSRNEEVWQAVNVSHVLSLGSVGRQEGLEEIQRFGRLVLYRFRGYNPARATMRGPGEARIELDEPEALDIRITAAAAGSRLLVHRSRYALWHAEMNGREVPISGASIGDSPQVFMELPVEDGLLRLRYRAGAPEWTGTIVSWLSLLGLLLLVLARLLPSFGGWSRRVLQPLAGPCRDGTTLAVLALAVLGPLLVVLRLLLPAGSPTPGRAVLVDLAHHLDGARGEVVRPSGATACSPPHGNRIQCPGASWNYAGEVIVAADHILRQCIWFHPIEGARFTLHFDDVPLGDYIQGHFAIADIAAEPPSPHAVNLTVLVDGIERGQFPCPSRRGWFTWEAATPGRRGTRGRVTLQSDAAFTGKRHFCFTAFTTLEDP